MTRRVSGYMAFNGKFFPTQEECDAYEAKQQLYVAIHARVDVFNQQFGTMINHSAAASTVFNFLDTNSELVYNYLRYNEPMYDAPQLSQQPPSVTTDVTKPLEPEPNLNVEGETEWDFDPEETEVELEAEAEVEYAPPNYDMPYDDEVEIIHGPTETSTTPPSAPSPENQPDHAEGFVEDFNPTGHRKTLP